MAKTSQDVSEDSSTSNTAEAKAVDTTDSLVTKGETNAKSDEFDTDLFSEKDKSIPYHVFKERNAKLREAERELKKLKTDMDRRVQDEVRKKEFDLRKELEDRLYQQSTTMQGQSNDLSVDNYSYGVVDDKKVTALEKQLSEIKERLNEVTTSTEQERIKKTVENLSLEYPALDVEHVYAIKRARPNMSWAECAEYSHNKFATHLESKWKEMIEKKKQSSKRPVISAESLKSLKPEERPKSWNEARKKVSQFFGDN